LTPEGGLQRKTATSTATHKCRRLLALALVSLAALNIFCERDLAQDPSASQQAAASTIEPKAGTWRTWVLASGDQLRLQPPPNRKATRAEVKELQALESQRDAAALDIVNFWDAGSPSYRWERMAADEAAKNGLGTPRAARVFSLVSIAIYDAMVAAWDSKYAYNRPRPSEFNSSLTTVLPNPNSPSYPSEHAVAAGAASIILAFLFPADAKLFSDKADEAGRSRLLAGVQYPSDVAAGLDLGRAVGALVVDRAKTDGSDARWTGTVPTGPGLWSGTNPAEPTVPTWKTWVLASGRQLRPGPPPAFDSAEEAAELAELKSFPRALPAAGDPFNRDRAAMFWQGGAFQAFEDLIHQKIFENKLDADPPRAARVYSYVHVALYDSVVACWDGKYAYWAIRPFQLDPTVTTLFPTPNHPSYPSAHTAISGPYAESLSYFFPRDADLFRSKAREAAESRIWAGIHFRSDIEVGLALAKSVTQLVTDRASHDGSQ
jgi:membrane-associated phospholipid phosphatase